jgi:TRIAP1/MDM35 family protein
VNADLNENVAKEVNEGNKVQKEEPVKPKASKDPTAGHGTGHKVKSGVESKLKAGQDDCKKSSKGDEVEKLRDKGGKSECGGGKERKPGGAEKKNVKSAAGVAGGNAGSGDHAGSHEDSKKKDRHSDDHKYRECGDIRTERVDVDLADDIDQSELEPVQSLVPECYNLKVEYDQCFQHWFAHEFLNGSTSLEPCADLMKRYTDCVKKGLQEQEVQIYPSNCLYGSSDPNYRKLDHPRKKPPAGAEVHHE